MALSSTLDRIAECQECKSTLTPETLRPGPFDCPYCAKFVRPIRRPSYLWYAQWCTCRLLSWRRSTAQT